MTGVGIWFIIALVHPAATSSLIHSFVFGWAIEWVFFIGEIVALLVYYYFFNKLRRTVRLNIAFLYFVFAWLNLVVINGIIAYMLTPGKWLETRNFWHGFFNLTYFPLLFFRTFIAIMFAGIFGYVTSAFLKEPDFRQKMMRYCSKWMLLPMIGLIPSGIWYYYAVSEVSRNITFRINPETIQYLNVLLVSTILIFVLVSYL